MELRGIPSRRQMKLWKEVQMQKDDGLAVTSRRLLRSIHNSKEIREKLREDEPIENNKFMNRNRSLPVLNNQQYLHS